MHWAVRQFLRTRPKNSKKCGQWLSVRGGAASIAEALRFALRKAVKLPRSPVEHFKMGGYLTRSALLSRIGDKDLSQECPHCKEFPGLEGLATYRTLQHPNLTISNGRMERQMNSYSPRADRPGGSGASPPISPFRRSAAGAYPVWRHWASGRRYPGRDAGQTALLRHRSASTASRN
jgi:hypothetical protein